MNKIQSKKKLSYYIGYNLSIPFEIKINDISIAKNIEKGKIMDFQYLNPFILSSGTQKISFIATTFNATQTYKPENIANIKLGIYSSENGEDGPFTIIKSLEIKPILEPVNRIENSWFFEATVPYEIEGWKNSQNLLKKDKKELLVKVVKFYKEVASTINNGNSSSFTNMYKKSDFEIAQCYYFTQLKLEELVEEERTNKLIKSKGNVKPLEKFTLKLYANGRLVTLEKENGDSPLYAEAERTIERFGFYLHIPKNSNELEIIR